MDAMTVYGLPGAIIVITTVILAALWDLAYRRIPNRLTASLLGLWVAATAWDIVRHGTAGFPNAEMVFGIECAVAVVMVGFFLFCMRAVGAGDVKLASVLCLWLGEGAFTFLVVTALAGGLLILQLPRLQRVEMALAVYTTRLPALAHILSKPVDTTGQSSNGFPYAPAIAAGTLFTILRTWA